MQIRLIGDSKVGVNVSVDDMSIDVNKMFYVQMYHVDRDVHWETSLTGCKEASHSVHYNLIIMLHGSAIYQFSCWSKNHFAWKICPCISCPHALNSCLFNARNSQLLNYGHHLAVFALGMCDRRP